jgi:hypothetical protein
MAQRFCFCYLQQFDAIVCAAAAIRYRADFSLIGNRFPRHEWKRVSRRLEFYGKSFSEKNS